MTDKNKKEKKETPPVDDDQPDLNKMMESTVRGKETKADTLLMLADNAEFFRNGDEPYAAIRVGEHTEIRPLGITPQGGLHFRWWLNRQFWIKTKKPADSETLNSVINTLRAKAIYDGEEHKLHNRVAWHEGAIWYDLADKEWAAVRITKDGWEVTKPPILFRRYQHQEAQVYPIKGGSIELILDFINIKKEGDKILFLVLVVYYFVPDVPHPILAMYGPQGSGKSGACATVGYIVDPSRTRLLSLPKDKNELVQQLEHHWFAAYDNITSFPDWISNSICRAVTGEGDTKRVLYTDDEDIIRNYIRCISLNGINCAAVNPDILDRCLLFELDRVPRMQRKTTKELWKAFEEARQAILGGIFDVLSKALALRPNVKLSMLPRMADFAEWGYAIAEAMGYRGQDFLDAYYANIEAQNKEALTSNPVGEAILKFMEDRTEWEGTPSQLLNELEMIAEVLKIGVKSKSWPKASNSLSRKLNVLKVNLLEEGILFELLKSGDRRIRLRRIEKGGETGSTGNTVQTDLSSESESANHQNKDDIKDDTIHPSISSVISPREKQHQKAKAGWLDNKDDISLTMGRDMCQRDKINLILNAIPLNNTTIVEKIQEETGLPGEYITATITHLKNEGHVIETRQGMYRRVL